MNKEYWDERYARSEFHQGVGSVIRFIGRKK